MTALCRSDSLICMAVDGLKGQRNGKGRTAPLGTWIHHSLYTSPPMQRRTANRKRHTIATSPTAAMSSFPSRHAPTLAPAQPTAALDGASHKEAHTWRGDPGMHGQKLTGS